jgi:putative transposase
MAASPCKGHRFPPELISHAVWSYHRFALSHRDVEELLAERGIHVSYEAIRLWCRKFGPAYTEQLRRRRPGPADKWHVDEMQLKIRGRKYWLWRAVDQDGFVLDIPVQERRREQVAVASLRRVLAAAGGEPRVIITDKLASYVPAVKRVLPTTEHRRHKRLNNRAEHSPLPARERERVLQRFTSAQHAQSFLAPSSAVCNQFRPRRHRLSAHHSREIMRDRFHTRQEVVGTTCP